MTKFHNIRTKIDGILFDSKLESRFYEFIKQLKETGQIQDFKMQVKYEIFPAFEKNGKKYRKIEYVADFVVYHEDGRLEVIDVKGVETDVFKMKHKMFEYKYPDLTLQTITYSKIDGGWVALDTVIANRKIRKKGKV